MSRRVLGIALSALFVLAGCGDDGGGATEPDDVETTIDSPDETAEPDDAEEIDDAEPSGDDPYALAEELCERLPGDEIASLLGVDDVEARAVATGVSRNDFAVQFPACAFQSGDLEVWVGFHDGAATGAPSATAVFEAFSTMNREFRDVPGLGDEAILDVDEEKVIVLAGDVVVTVAPGMSTEQVPSQAELEAVAAVALDVLG